MAPPDTHTLHMVHICLVHGNNKKPTALLHTSVVSNLAATPENEPLEGTHRQKTSLSPQKLKISIGLPESARSLNDPTTSDQRSV